MASGKFTVSINEDADQSILLTDVSLEQCFYAAHSAVYKEHRCVQISDTDGKYLAIHSDDACTCRMYDNGQKECEDCQSNPCECEVGQIGHAYKG